MELHWFHSQKSIDHKYKGLLLDSQFYYIDLHVYPDASTTPPLLLQLYINFLLLSPSFFLQLFCLFWATCIFMWILESVCQFQKWSSDFDG
jgi:hypothetical protein